MEKSLWGDGPWQEEVDSYRWTSDEGYRCMVLRHPEMGFFCGYLALPPGHPFNYVSYDSIHGMDENICVHGGLTFSSNSHSHLDDFAWLQEQPGSWIIGFDCGHAGDESPGLNATMRSIGCAPHPADWEVYRDLQYVIDEVNKLSAQCFASAPIDSWTKWRLILKDRYTRLNRNWFMWKFHHTRLWKQFWNRSIDFLKGKP